MGVYRADQDLSDRPAKISNRLLRQIAHEVLRTMRSIPLGGDPSSYMPTNMVPYSPGCIPAIVTSAIGPCTGSSSFTPGQGNAALYNMATDGATVASADLENPNVPVLNWFLNSGMIAVGKHIMVCPWSYFYWLVSCDC
jgi:hypothetical protein